MHCVHGLCRVHDGDPVLQLHRLQLHHDAHQIAKQNIGVVPLPNATNEFINMWPFQVEFRVPSTSSLANVDAVCQGADNFVAASVLEVQHLSHVAYKQVHQKRCNDEEKAYQLVGCLLLHGLHYGEDQEAESQRQRGDANVAIQLWSVHHARCGNYEHKDECDGNDVDDVCCEHRHHGCWNVAHCRGPSTCRHRHINAVLLQDMSKHVIHVLKNCSCL
mmetsp:Transcript_8874/g.15929  ORF Transcript_8874/g.15929 Transcript_8874/m.15929 type:complete len:218 (+) Transcript_8874:440-1093(+)